MFKILKGLPRLFCAAVALFCFSSISSCTFYTQTAAKVDNLVARGDYSSANSLLNADENIYGSINKLLYLMDKGFVSHIARDYSQSINIFEKAKQEYDRLYTKSVTGIVGSWLINDYAAAYRGEDFERVMINIFQSLNYSMLNKTEDALVEARDADSKLKLINSRYSLNQKNVYKEDAFTRMFMGILYEAGMDSRDYNDAFISYSKAADIYENDYIRNYNVNIPLLLKENLFATAEFMGNAELDRLKFKYGNVKFESLTEKAKKSEIYLIQYNGLSPSKIQITIPIILPDGYVTPLAFPQYERRNYLIRDSQLWAENNKGQAFIIKTELAEDIGAIAIKNLENRKARVIAKALATSAGKYFAEKAGEREINKEFGRDVETGFTILSDLFNIFTNKADLRCWETLPSEIRIARLLLEPGEYSLVVSNFDYQGRTLGEIDLGKINLRAGEKKFFIVRTVK